MIKRIKSNDTKHDMRLRAINILFITLLMAMVGVNTAYADERDGHLWMRTRGTPSTVAGQTISPAIEVST